MNKEISKAIMTRTRLRNRFLKNSSNRKRDLFRKQRNLCVSLLRKAKKDYFSCVVKNLNIPNYEGCDPLSDNIDHATLKAIVKWRNHPSIFTITSEHENTPKFSFTFVSKEHVLGEIQIMDSSKAIQESDIPVKLTKENGDLFAEIICKYFNESLEKSKFPDCLKRVHVPPEIIIDQLAFCQFCTI